MDIEVFILDWVRCRVNKMCEFKPLGWCKLHQMKQIALPELHYKMLFLNTIFIKKASGTIVALNPPQEDRPG